MRVYVLLFNARTENEGIHTIQIGDRHKILMFASHDDATRFALMLEAQDFPTATIEEMDAEDVKEFCESTNYEWEIIEEGRLEVPPENNVAELDWSVEEAQQSESDISDDQLEKIRRQLEGLL